jgi:MFS superfamily sulfate permease-like transporter
VAGNEPRITTIVAAVVTPLAAGDVARHVSVAAALAIASGMLCIAGGLAGLGFLANFLSRPILLGYLNGIAISIIAGQLGKLFGFGLPSSGFFRQMAAFLTSLDQTHVWTVGVGLGAFAVLRALKRVWPRAPGPLVAVVLGSRGRRRSISADAASPWLETFPPDCLQSSCRTWLWSISSPSSTGPSA